MVDVFSSMTAGPSIRMPGLQGAATEHRHVTRIAGIEIGWPQFVRLCLAAVLAKRFIARLRDEPDRGHLEIDDLDCLGLRHVAIAALMGVVEAPHEIGEVVRPAQARHRHRHLVGLAAIAHAGVAARLQALARELLLHQVGERGCLHLGEDRVELGRRRRRRAA